MANKLFKVFAGRNVSIIMRSVRGSQVINEDTVIEGSVVIQGYLLDEDENFYYIGESDEEITEALQKEDVVRVYIEGEESMLDFEITGDQH